MVNHISKDYQNKKKKKKRKKLIINDRINFSIIIDRLSREKLLTYIHTSQPVLDIVCMNISGLPITQEI